MGNEQQIRVKEGELWEERWKTEKKNERERNRGKQTGGQGIRYRMLSKGHMGMNEGAGG